MKTERRHELQENELANWLGTQLQKLQPYAMVLVGLGILATLAFFVSSYTSGRSAAARQQAWAAYFDAMSTNDPKKFEEVAVAYAGTQAAGWSLQTAGDLLLNQGIGSLFQNRAQSTEQLKAAQSSYEAVLEDYRDGEMLEQRAMLGLAKCLESQGDLEAAKAKYQELISRWNDSQIARLAEARVAQLDSESTQDWYSWFAKQEPVQSPLTDPSMFQNLPQLPDAPDLTMPQPGQMLGGSETNDETNDETSSESNDESSDDTTLDFDLDLQPADTSDAASDTGVTPETTLPETPDQ